MKCQDCTSGLLNSLPVASLRHDANGRGWHLRSSSTFNLFLYFEFNNINSENADLPMYIVKILFKTLRACLLVKDNQISYLNKTDSNSWLFNEISLDNSVKWPCSLACYSITEICIKWMSGSDFPMKKILLHIYFYTY